MDKGKHKAHIWDTEVLFSSFLVLLQRMEFTSFGGYHADSGQVYIRLSRQSEAQRALRKKGSADFGQTGTFSITG